MSATKEITRVYRLAGGGNLAGDHEIDGGSPPTGGQGVEPRLEEPESSVLPLDDPPLESFIRKLGDDCFRVGRSISQALT